MIDRNCLSFWFPRLIAAGVPVPRTEIVATAVNLVSILDGEKPDGWDAFLSELRRAVETIGTPAFLRTGQGSGKHEWTETCYLASAEDLPRHVAALVEWSHIVDFLGLPTSVWAVREFLPLHHDFTAFRGMPVAREFRWFIRDGKPLCCHPYWPPDTIYNASVDDWRSRLETMNTLTTRDVVCHDALLRRVCPQFADGGWSVDIAQHADGRWFVTDMAVMEQSFHWPGCPNGPPAEPEPSGYVPVVLKRETP